MRYSDLTKQLSPDDYEEAKLLKTWLDLNVRRSAQQNQPAGMDKKQLSDTDRQLLACVKALGYDPESQKRPAKDRGKPRRSALPVPLPDKGTKLQSCIGETYTVVGYAKTSLGQPNSLILLLLEDDSLVARQTIHLFAGTMHTKEPFVTWDTDPRKLKPGQPVPLGLRRATSKAVLGEDRHVDPATLPVSDFVKKRSYMR